MTDEIEVGELEILDSTKLKSATKCPVCKGWGGFQGGKVKCNGCQGKGWVIVDLDPGEKLVEPLESWQVKGTLR